MSTYYRLSDISDLYKEVTGYRPGVEFSQKWVNATLQEKQEIWDDLMELLGDDDKAF